MTNPNEPEELLLEEVSPPEPRAEVPPEALESGSSLWSDAWQKLAKNRAALAGVFIVGIMMFASLTAPLIAAHITHFDFDEQHLTGFAKPPGAHSIPEIHTTFFDLDEHPFAEIDLNHDDAISAKELSLGLAKLEFQRFDLDESGLLEPEEIEDAPVNLFKLEENVSPILLTIWAAHINYFEQTFDQHDLNHDHNLTLSERSAAKLALSEEKSIHAGLLKDLFAQNAQAPFLDRHQLREIARPLLEIHCATPEDCPISFGASLLFTDIFPEGEAETLLRKLDTNGDHLLQATEFSGLPEPHTHWLGTDIAGRDLFTRILYGGRISFLVGLLATFVSFIIGVSWGAIAGYSGGRIDNWMMRFVDILYGLPFMFLVILLMVIFGRNILLLFVALGAVQWLTMSRIVRGQVISLKQREFIEAARSIGVDPLTIIYKHIIPNALGPIIVYATLTVPAVMLEEAFLSFLGLGVQAPMASFGTLVSAGSEDMSAYPWLIIYPGLALALTLLSLNFIGDGLRDALDPQTRKD